MPAPLAARVRREGILYRGDLLTRHLPDASTLADCLKAGAVAVPWSLLGKVLGRLHAAGVWHADLNANNLLIDGQGAVFVIDFDRGRRRPPALGWQAANLARLWRSLTKLGLEPEANAGWPLLLEGHREALAGGA